METLLNVSVSLFRHDYLDRTRAGTRQSSVKWEQNIPMSIAAMRVVKQLNLAADQSHEVDDTLVQVALNGIEVDPAFGELAEWLSKNMFKKFDKINNQAFLALEQEPEAGY